MLNDALIIGFDFGLRHIGMAIGNTHTKKARPLSSLLAKQGEPDWRILSQCLKDWQPACLIVGLPTCMDDSEQYTTFAARAFAKKLKDFFHLPVYFADERLSTVEVRAMLFEQGGYRKIKKSDIDSLAACVILEQWLQTAHTT